MLINPYRFGLPPATFDGAATAAPFPATLADSPNTFQGNLTSPMFPASLADSPNTFNGATTPAAFTIAGSNVIPLTYSPSNVVFQLHGDTAFPYLDSGNAPHGITHNNSSLSTTTGKPSYLGGTLLVAASDRGIRAAVGASDTSFKFGTGMWFAKATIYKASGSIARIFDTRSAPGQNGWTMTVNSSGVLGINVDGVDKGVTSGVVPDVTPVEVLAGYDGTKLRLFVGGILMSTTTVALNITTGQHLAIGNTNDLQNASSSNNYYCQLLIVKGESGPTASYPVQTAKMADAKAGGSTLQPQTDASFQNVISRQTFDTDLADVGVGARVWAANGGAAVSATQSKFGGKSLSLDGTGDFLTTPDDPLFDFGTGNYQIQHWVRRNGAKSGGSYTYSCYTGPTDGWLVSQDGGYTYSFNATGDGADVQTASVLPDVTWGHRAVGRKDSVLYIFADGMLEQFKDDTQATNCNSQLFLGRLNNTYTAYDFLGNIDDTQIVAGECQLFQSFAVPTGPLPVPLPGSLDAYQSNVDAAYGFNRLFASYTGKPLFKVRNGTTNAVTDIYATSGGGYDTVAYAAAVGASTPYLVKWYDQSGRGAYLDQTYDPTMQPQIFDAGGGVLYTYSDTVNKCMSAKLSGVNLSAGQKKTYVWAGAAAIGSVSNNRSWGEIGGSGNVNILYDPSSVSIFVNTVAGNSVKTYRANTVSDRAFLLVDTTQSSFADKFKLYVNNVRNTDGYQGGAGPTTNQNLGGGMFMLGEVSTSTGMGAGGSQTSKFKGFVVLNRLATQADAYAISGLL